MITIRSYNDAEFHAKVQEFAKLNDDSYFGHIAPYNQRADLHVQRKVTHLRNWNNHRISSTVQFITNFVSENGSRLTERDLPFLDQIARFMDQHGDSETKNVYTQLHHKIVPLFSLPQEIYQRIVSSVDVYLSVRRTCKTAYERMPLESAFMVNCALAGTIVDAVQFAHLLMSMIDAEHLENAHQLLEMFLDKASDADQMLFWDQFSRDAHDASTIRKLYDTPFVKVERLFFRIPCDVDNVKFCVDLLIKSCPNLHTLTIATFGKGDLPDTLLDALAFSRELKVFKMPNFYLENPLRVINCLGAVTEIVLKTGYSREIKEYVEASGNRFKGLFIDFQDEEQVPDVKTLLQRCPNLDAFYLNHKDLASIVPKSTQELVIRLPGNYNDNAFLSWLEHAELFNLRSLTFEIAGTSKVSLDEILRIARKMPKVMELYCPNLVINDQNAVIRRLSRLSTRLSTLSLSFDMRTCSAIQKVSLNRKSNLKRLTIESKVDQEMTTLVRLHGIFCACNPEELVTDLWHPETDMSSKCYSIQQTDSNELQFAPTSSAKNNFYAWPNQSRLKRIVFLDCQLIDVCVQLRENCINNVVTKNSKDEFKRNAIFSLPNH